MSVRAVERVYDRYAFLAFGIFLLGMAGAAAVFGLSPFLLVAGLVGGAAPIAVHVGRAPYWLAFAAFAVVAALLAGWLWLAPGYDLLALVGTAAGVGALYRTVQFYRHGPPAPSSQ